MPQERFLVGWRDNLPQQRDDPYAALTPLGVPPNPQSPHRFLKQQRLFQDSQNLPMLPHPLPASQ